MLSVKNYLMFSFKKAFCFHSKTFLLIRDSQLDLQLFAMAFKSNTTTLLILVIIVLLNGKLLKRGNDTRNCLSVPISPGAQLILPCTYSTSANQNSETTFNSSTFHFTYFGPISCQRKPAKNQSRIFLALIFFAQKSRLFPW